MRLGTLLTLLFISIQTIAGEKETSNDNPLLERINGILYFDGTPYSGYIIEESESGSLLSKVNWKQGKRHGSYRTWYSNGQKSEERQYFEGRKNGLHMGWFADGSPRFILNFRNGVYHGNCREWHANGQLYTDCNFDEGAEIGSQQSWRFDGKAVANYVVKDGHRYGVVGSKTCLTTIE